MTEQQILEQFNARKGARLDKQFKNGNIRIKYRVPCWKCNGNGIIAAYAHIFAGECFVCRGTGYTLEHEILMTPENKAKHDAKVAKEREAQAKEQARIEAELAAKEKAEAEEKARHDAEIKAQKAISQYVGQIGDRIEGTYTLDHVAYWEQQAFTGYGTTTMYLYVFKDDGGNKLIWKTIKGCCVRLGNDQYKTAEQGDKVTIKGTIKDHNEYDDEKQTVLTRCKVIDITEGAV